MIVQILQCCFTDLMQNGGESSKHMLIAIVELQWVWRLVTRCGTPWRTAEGSRLVRMRFVSVLKRRSLWSPKWRRAYGNSARWMNTTRKTKALQLIALSVHMR